MKYPTLERKSVFNKKPDPEEQRIDEVIAASYLNLKNFGTDTKEYAKTVKQIAELEKIKTSLTKKERLFTPDTLLLVGANLLGILLILNFEKMDVVTSKSLGFVSKTRI